MINQYTSHFI